MLEAKRHFVHENRSAEDASRVKVGDGKVSVMLMLC